MSASRTTTAERGSRPCCCPPTARQRVARYWSFTRMLWRPFWSPLSASRRFAGGSVRNVRSASQSPYGVGAVWMPYCQKLAAAKRPAETIIHAAYTILRSFAWRLKRMAGTDATTTSSGPYEAIRNSSTDHGPTKLVTRSGRTSAPSAHSARVQRVQASTRESQGPVSQRGSCSQPGSPTSLESACWYRGGGTA